MTAAGLDPIPPRARPAIKYRSSRSQSIRAARAPAIKYTALLIFAVLVLMPVYILVVTGFKGSAEIDPSHAWSLPSLWTFDAWRQAWSQLSGPMKNSLELVIPATIISTLLGSMNGFVLAKWRFPGANFVFTFFLFGMFIPYQAVMIPLTQLLSNLRIPSQIPQLAFAHIVYGIPITTLIFRNYYATIPDDLMEAARIDGAGMLRTLRSVVLPISIPAFVVAAIWQFTSIWNDFLFAVFIITDPNKWPVTVALNNTTGSIVSPYNLQMSASLLASLPTLVVYILLGRYFMRGLMAGALKG
jgi:glucose/mannose transport system permease protein